MAGLATTISTILAIVSATLAVSAFIFSWVTFRNNVKMQMEAQAILAKVSEKVEVVVERTSHQIDRAWEYFTANPQEIALATDETSLEREQLIDQVKEEARKEVVEAIKEVGLDKDKFDILVSQVESLVTRSSERTQEILEKNQLYVRIRELENELHNYLKTIGESYPPDIPFKDLANQAAPFIPRLIHKELMNLAELKSKLMHEDLPESAIVEGRNRATRLMGFFSGIAPKN